MQLSLRHKHWVGALASIAAQTALYFAIRGWAGDLLTALVFLCLNIGLAASYRASNSYLTGARWASFLTLSYASYERHEYWYPYVYSSFMRLRDFNRPVELTQVLCPGPLEAAGITAITGFLIVVFYSYVIRWPEWTERWEMLRRAPFSASIGLQTIFAVTVLYPTVLAMVGALFFASVVSPLLRRQVRLNHIVFLSLPPLFALGNSTVALVASLVAGFIFLYFISFERSLSKNSASFALFAGLAFLALTVSLVENYMVLRFDGAPAALAAFVSFLITVGTAYVLLFRGAAAIELVRRLQARFTPKRWVASAWWAVRDHWVDREIDHRVHKRYTLRGEKKDLAFFIFGPRYWAPGSDDYKRVAFTVPNFAPAAIVLAFYSIWLFVDAVLIAVPAENVYVLSGALASGFLFILAVPVVVLVQELRKRKAMSFLTTALGGLSALVFAGFMVITFYFGLGGNSEALVRSSSDTSSSSATTPGATAEDKCECEYNGVRLDS